MGTFQTSAGTPSRCVSLGLLTRASTANSKWRRCLMWLNMERAATAPFTGERCLQRSDLPLHHDVAQTASHHLIGNGFCVVVFDPHFTSIVIL